MQDEYNKTEEYKEYLTQKHPEWSESTVNTHVSDASFIWNNTVIPGFWKVFVDDEGYGVVTKQFVKNEEIVVDVQFENGKVKKYLPKYQKNKLLVIKE